MPSGCPGPVPRRHPPEDAIGPAKVAWDVPQDVVAQAYKRLEPSEELYTKSAVG